ncbi:Holliday junction resolvase RecU [Bacillus sp. UMB0899]|nr:Holliday junction resolvase RecU [Bacillus sp. UMB0899]
MKYPTGKKYTSPTSSIKNKVSTTRKEKLNFGNRGMGLEEILNRTNNYYNNVAKCAVIHKKPTPIQIVKVDYPVRSAATIREAYFKQASTTDYNGVYKGKYIDFEAKETKNKTSFPLSNFHEHQVEHMRQVKSQGGITFIIVQFTAIKEYFLLDAKHVISYWDDQCYGGRKSIPKSFFDEKGHEVLLKITPELDYLSVINDVYLD